MSETKPTAAMIDSTEVRQDGLDTITVFWRNWEPGKGEVTIYCYGSAWTAYFGAMAGNTIQYEKYLSRIVSAIKGT